MIKPKSKLDKAKLVLLSMQRHSWEQGVAMQAFLEAGDSDVVIAMAKEAVYRSIDDGRVAIMHANAITDPCSTGEALIYAANKTDDPKLKEGLKNLLNWALIKAPRNKTGVLYHLMTGKQMWVDTLYMLPPFLAAAGHLDEAFFQFDGNWELLYQPESKLLCHKWDDELGEFDREAHWGSGNGWAIASLSRLIEVCTQNNLDEKKELFINRAKDLIEGLLSNMRDDGLFHDVVDDPSTFVEVTLSMMLAYSLFRGMKRGWLSKDFEPIVEKLRVAANNKIDKYGFVQDACGAPHFDKVGQSPEAQTFYVLMEVAAQDFYS